MADMVVTGVEILNLVAKKLFDPHFVRWSVYELYQDMNDGQREIVFYKPDANTVTAPMTLEASIKQTLPDNGRYLFDVIDNAGGRLVSIIDQRLLSEANPNWHNTTTTSATGINYYSYNERDPTHFYVYPCPSGTMWAINITYSENPENVTATGTLDNDMVATQVTGNINVSAEYKNALIDYVLFRAFSKDAQYSSAQRAQIHYQAFANALGIRGQVEAAEDPNVKKPSVSER